MTIQKISDDELRNILRLHAMWLNDTPGGDRANLQDLDLQNANFFGASLRGANLRSANLQGADLRYADLQEADLQGADLQGAICDSNIQKTWRLKGSKWLRSDVPWWLGHKDQNKIVLIDE